MNIEEKNLELELIELELITDILSNNEEITDIVITTKEGWGGVVRFNFDSLELFCPCFFSNSNKILETYRWSEDYACHAFTEEIELIDRFRNWNSEELSIFCQE